MADISHNEIARLLQDRIDPVLLNVLLNMYEMFNEVQKQAMHNAKVALELADTIGQVVELHHRTQEQVKALRKTINPSGIEWKSEEIN